MNSKQRRGRRRSRQLHAPVIFLNRSFTKEDFDNAIERIKGWAGLPDPPVFMSPEEIRGQKMAYDRLLAKEALRGKE